MQKLDHRHVSGTPFISVDGNFPDGLEIGTPIIVKESQTETTPGVMCLALYNGKPYTHENVDSIYFDFQQKSPKTRIAKLFKDDGGWVYNYDRQNKPPILYKVDVLSDLIENDFEINTRRQVTDKKLPSYDNNLLKRKYKVKPLYYDSNEVDIISITWTVTNLDTNEVLSETQLEENGFYFNLYRNELLWQSIPTTIYGNYKIEMQATDTGDLKSDISTVLFELVKTEIEIDPSIYDKEENQSLTKFNGVLRDGMPLLFTLQSDWLQRIIDSSFFRINFSLKIYDKNKVFISEILIEKIDELGKLIDRALLLLDRRTCHLDPSQLVSELTYNGLRAVEGNFYELTISVLDEMNNIMKKEERTLQGAPSNISKLQLEFDSATIDYNKEKIDLKILNKEFDSSETVYTKWRLVGDFSSNENAEIVTSNLTDINGRNILLNDQNVIIELKNNLGKSYYEIQIDVFIVDSTGLIIEYKTFSVLRSLNLLKNNSVAVRSISYDRFIKVNDSCELKIDLPSNFTIYPKINRVVLLEAEYSGGENLYFPISNDYPISDVSWNTKTLTHEEFTVFMEKETPDIKVLLTPYKMNKIYKFIFDLELLGERYSISSEPMYTEYCSLEFINGFTTVNDYTDIDETMDFSKFKLNLSCDSTVRPTISNLFVSGYDYVKDLGGDINSSTEEGYLLSFNNISNNLVISDNPYFDLYLDNTDNKYELGIKTKSKAFGELEVGVVLSFMGKTKVIKTPKITVKTEINDVARVYGGTFTEQPIKLNKYVTQVVNENSMLFSAYKESDVAGKYLIDPTVLVKYSDIFTGKSLVAIDNIDVSTNAANTALAFEIGSSTFTISKTTMELINITSNDFSKYLDRDLILSNSVSTDLAKLFNNEQVFIKVHLVGNSYSIKGEFKYVDFYYKYREFVSLPTEVFSIDNLPNSVKFLSESNVNISISGE